MLSGPELRTEIVVSDLIGATPDGPAEPCSETSTDAALLVRCSNLKVAQTKSYVRRFQQSLAEILERSLTVLRRGARVNAESMVRRKKSSWLKNQPPFAQNVSVEIFFGSIHLLKTVQKLLS